MSQQPETPKQPHSESKPCKMGCGFFGSNTTGDCCSKCWAQIRPKVDTKVDNDAHSNSTTPPNAFVCSSDSNNTNDISAVIAVDSSPSAKTEQAHVASTIVENSNDVSLVPLSTETVTHVASPSKKKRNKTSYKCMMAGILESTATKDLNKEKEKLRDGMGGGQFKKIDHI